MTAPSTTDVVESTGSQHLPRARTAWPAIRAVCLLGLTIFVGFQANFAARQITSGEADFEYFYKAGRWVLDHGTIDARVDVSPDGSREPRGGIEWYLPSLQRITALYAWMPFQIAGAVWLTLNLVAFFLLLRLIGQRMTGLPPTDWPVTMIVPVLLLTLFWHWEFRLNQIDTLVLLLLVGTFACWESGRARIAGFWLGLAVLLKLTPGLLVIWFAFKRQYATVLAASLTLLLAGPVADVVVWGPEYSRDVYLEWVENAVTRSSHRGLVMNQTEMDWRNQGLSAVASRWLHPTNYATHFDNDPRIRFQEPEATMNVVSLPREVVAGLVVGLAALSLIALIWIIRRPASDLSIWQLRLEFALCLLTLLWLMPVLRRYHFIMALPAIAVLAGIVHYRPAVRGWAPWTLVSIWSLALLQLAVAARPLFGHRVPEAAGVLLLVIPVLGVPVLWMLRALRSHRARLPADAYAVERLARQKAVGRAARSSSPAAGTGEPVSAA